jgi:hypothetical protein
MDDVIAVEVRLVDGGSRYFLTWGRIQDPVDPQPVCALVLRMSRSCALGGEPVTARLCASLREAADSPQAPYFYECFKQFCPTSRPRGRGYRRWRARTGAQMEHGKQIAYCGRPADARDTADDRDTDR